MGRVQVVSPDGVRGTVDEKDVPNLPEGAHVLTAQELAEAKLSAEYDNASTLSKVSGIVTGIGAVPPSIAAYQDAAKNAVSAGTYGAAVKTGADIVSPGAGKAYAQRTDDLATGYPGATTAGTVAGIAGGVAMGAAGGAGAGAGAARALPMNALSAAGAPIEHGITRALGGLASRGALGQAAARGAAAAVRGAAEGAAYGAVEQASSNIVHDKSAGEKLYTVLGHGALSGLVVGGALGAGGSLLSSAFRAKPRIGAPTGEAMPPPPELAPIGREVRLSHDTLDAGLREAAPRAESPLSFARREVSLRGQGKVGRVATADPIGIEARLRIDPDAGLRAPEGKVTEPLFSMLGKGRDVGEVQMARDLFRKGKVPATSRPARQGFDIGIDPDAGIAARGPGGEFQGKFATEDPLYTSTAKDARRRVGLRPDVEAAGPVDARAPIEIPGERPRLPWMDPDAVAAELGKLDANGAARSMAQDQAWKAVGAGFGLQTTRYAKEAKRYFPNGTRDLGEVALRYNLIDAGPAGSSPSAAAWRAAKTGTVDEIALRAAGASDEVGSKIGAITDASGARVALADLDAGIRKVRSQYDKIAGNEHVVSAIDNYHASLRSKLEGAADEAASIQRVLEQRKGLDEIVYRETKTLDPGRRVEALRSVRAEIEGAITDALDAASGRVPGAQRAEYETLKRDYHALRILSEAAEDSAARASKGATLGLTDKIVGAAAGGAASLMAGPLGGLVSGPAAAFASKLVRERGNAAAAAFLSRAAEQGMIARAIETVNARVTGAARGVLRETSGETRGKTPRPSAPSPRETARQQGATREAGRAAQVARIREGEAIVKWTGDVRANPDRLTDQIQEAAAIVAQNGGPEAATTYTGATLRAINFIVGYVPVKERRDPLDPRSTPPLTYEEADKLVRAAKYATRPMAVWEDFEKGKVTTEGIRAAKAFMPETFAEFQTQLLEHVQDHMLRNQKLTASQRLKVDRLLEFPAGPDLRPDTIARLQANLKPAQEAPPPAGPTGANPVPLKVQQSGFDAIEARVSG